MRAFSGRDVAAAAGGVRCAGHRGEQRGGGGGGGGRIAVSFGGAVPRMSWLTRRSSTAHSAARFPCRDVHTSPVRRALEKVEVAHLRSYQQPSPSFRLTGGASSSGSAPASPRGASSASPLYRRLVAPQGQHDDLPTSLMDYADVADDAAGPPPTRENGPIVARVFGGAPLAAERFFFRDSSPPSPPRRHGHLDGGHHHHHAADAEEGRGARGAAGFSPSSSSSSPSASSSHHSRAMPFCLLCREEIDPAVMTTRQHILTDSRASHTNHNCREVVLDSLALLCMRGYPIERIHDVWAHTLFHHPRFTRVRSWVDPAWPLERRADGLFQLLRALQSAGVVDLSLAGVTPDAPGNEAHHHRRRVAFERLEYIGDNAWGTHVSDRIMLLFPDQQWLYSERAYAFNCFRDAVEMNITNELVFDAMRLERLFPPEMRALLGSGKVKADIVEALIGELHLALWSREPMIHDDAPYVAVNDGDGTSVAAVLEHCLTELYDLIILNYCRDLSWNAIPLAKELAAQHIWLQTRPQLKPQKGFPRRVHGGMVRVQGGPGQGGVEGEKPVEVGAASPTPPPHGTAAAAVVPVVAPGGAAGTTTTTTATGTLVSIRVLPALPQLFPAATPMPQGTRGGNPLRAAGRDPTLLPPITRSAHTGRDVFEELIASFHRMKLLPEEEHGAEPRKDSGTPTPAAAAAATAAAVVVREEGSAQQRVVPQWRALVQQLDPAAAAVEELEKRYFADPYYHLTAAPTATEDSSSPRLWGSMPLPVATRRCPLRTAEQWLALIAARTYPPLQAAPESGAGEDGSAEAAGASGGCNFGASRLVPAGTRAPSAGVVLDGNLYHGKFALLGYSATGEDPLQLYLRHAAKEAEEAEKGEGEGEGASVLERAVAYWTADARRRSAQEA